MLVDPHPAADTTPKDDSKLLDNGDTVSGMVLPIPSALASKISKSNLEFFAVKFCPYQPLNADPVFAAVSKKHVSCNPPNILKSTLIPRPQVVVGKISPKSEPDGIFKTLRLVRDDDVGPITHI